MELLSKKDSFSSEEVRKLFKCLLHGKTCESIRLLLLTGMRSQELLALEAGHAEMDMTEHYLHAQDGVNHRR